MGERAINDGSMEALLSSFDQIYDEYKNGLSEIQSLRSNCDAEMKKREALLFTVQSLQSANERLIKLYAESLNKLADQNGVKLESPYISLKRNSIILKFPVVKVNKFLMGFQIESRVSFQRLKEELKRVNDEHILKETDYTNTIALLKQDYSTKVEGLESQFRELQIQKLENEQTINNLQQDLAVHRNHIESLTRRLEKVYVDVESKYHYEIQGLKDCLLVEQEEKNELSKKLQNLEKELLISRTKLVEHQQDMTSSRHVDTLKQRIMKLRKENEVLRRQLHDSKEV